MVEKFKDRQMANGFAKKTVADVTGQIVGRMIQSCLYRAAFRSVDTPIVVDAIAPFGDRDRLINGFLKELEESLSGGGDA